MPWRLAPHDSSSDKFWRPASISCNWELRIHFCGEVMGLELLINPQRRITRRRHFLPSRLLTDGQNARCIPKFCFSSFRFFENRVQSDRFESKGLCGERSIIAKFYIYSIFILYFILYFNHWVNTEIPHRHNPISEWIFLTRINRWNIRSKIWFIMYFGIHRETRIIIGK